MPNRLLSRSNVLVQHCEAAVLFPPQYACSSRNAVRRFSSLGRSLGSSAPVHAHTVDPPTTFTTEPNIDINSLKNTLRAHREANRAPVIRKTYKKGDSVRVEDPDVGLPAIEVKVPQTKAWSFRRIDLTPGQAFTRGTSRDLDVLWRISDTEKNPPLQYRLPWLRHLDSADSTHYCSAVERLGAEIQAFERYSSPSKEEQRAADDALRDVTECVSEACGDLAVDIIGSRATKLADPLSDLDINVSGPEHWDTSDEPSQNAPLKVLNRLHKHFRKPSKTYTRPPTIEVQYYLKQARVPILLCHHKPSGLPIQIQSTPRTYDSREYVKASLKEYPSLRGLFKALKQTLQMRGLTVGSSGGITSYPLLQMIVAALKFSEGRFHPSDVGDQFLFFLDFYADIDFSMHGISTEPIELFSKSVRRTRSHDDDAANSDEFEMHDKARLRESHKTFQGRSRKTFQRDRDYRMTLQDPANPLNDLGKSCYQIQDVQETFIALGATMKRVMADWDRASRTLDRAQQHTGARSLLESCIGGDYRIYEHERDELRRLGRSSSEKASAETSVEA
ncbi:hypothetical protein H2200_004626 [Cladophialophora chaetospira]|uniref:Poly(A) RNA polymerase mitochondrial-like central palm domain-containing protein n=1 Tax=Cladophialophora chaetospira TaxID=386627 RepID=A0AA38XDJ1_9EURO|nr:hypothetical protein H2200_004626 [Cladophialophora chaetospira]